MKVVTNYLLRGFYSIFISLVLFSIKSNAQAVTQIITDYGGYWKSSSSSINPVKPDNSHNLLAFILNGVQYSTGANDAKLTANGESFIAGDFRALPVSNISGTINSNTKIGLGALYDGVVNGASTPAPANNIPGYLTDGIKGLNLGTGAANLPVGTLTFSVNSLQLAAVGDSKPDILVTQIADPSTTLDRYEFTDANGVRVGNYIDISFNSMSSVGNWTADFYEASQNPMSLQAGFTQTDRPIRLWAADFSDFGINAGNYSSIAYFKITLGGNSDVAFVAYNYTAITVLPIKLSYFKANKIGSDVNLSWQTQTEINTSHFIVEHSLNGTHFTLLSTLSAAGNSDIAISYSFKHISPSTGMHYYRLKEVDKDGSITYSKIIQLSITPNNELRIANKGSNVFLITYPASDENFLKLINSEAKEILAQKIKQGTLQTQLDLSSLPKGIYYLIYTRKGEILSQAVVVK